jgi:sugar lactone lactonase YvrE
MRWEPGKEQLGGPPKDQLFMRFDPQGKLDQLWTVPKGKDGKEKPGECNWVHGVAVDANENLYVGDIMGRRVQRFRRLPDGTRENG